MTIMDNLLKELEKERDIALKHEHDNNHSWGYLNGIEKAIEIVKNCSIPAVVGRSEQLPILERCDCEEPNEEPIKVCMNCNGYVE